MKILNIDTLAEVFTICHYYTNDFILDLECSRMWWEDYEIE